MTTRPAPRPVQPASSNGSAGAGSHRAAKRALDLIEQVAAAPGPIGLSELARTLGLPKSSAHALARTLDDEGYLVRDRRGAYGLGPRLFSLLGRLPDRLALPRVARPIMQELVDTVDETTLLGVRHHLQIMYVEQVEARQFIRYVAQLGEPRPLHCTSIGKIFMASMPDDEVQSSLSLVPIERLTVYTKVELPAIVAELDSIRNQGFALNREESIPGVTAIGVPIREGGQQDGKQVAGLSLVGPTERMRGKLESIPARLMDAAARIGASIKSR